MLLPINGLKIEATAVTDKRNFLYDKGIEKLLILGEFETRGGVVDWQAKHERIRCQDNSSRKALFVMKIWFVQPWWQRLQGMAQKFTFSNKYFSLPRLSVSTELYIFADKTVFISRTSRESACIYSPVKVAKPWMDCGNGMRLSVYIILLLQP